MDKQFYSAVEILELVKKRQLTAAEGFKLFKELQRNHLNNSRGHESPEAVYFHSDWEAADVNPKQSHGEFLEHVLVFDVHDEMANLLKSAVANENKVTLVRPEKV